MNEVKMMAALDLLRFKAVKQMCEGKTTCILNEDDVQEILLVAGINLDPKSEAEIKVWELRTRNPFFN